MAFDQEQALPAMAAGRVMFVDREGTGEAGRSVVLFHGGGFSTSYSHLSSLADDISLGAEVSAGQPLGRSGKGAEVRVEARLAKRYAEKGFEPTAAEVLAPEANFALDAFGALVELDSLRANGTPPGESPPVFMPDLEEADLFTLSGGPLPVDILFASARGLETGYEPVISDVLEDDLGFGQVLGEEIDDIS